MSKKIFTNIDLKNNEIKNAKLELATKTVERFSDETPSISLNLEQAQQLGLKVNGELIILNSGDEAQNRYLAYYTNGRLTPLARLDDIKNIKDEMSSIESRLAQSLASIEMSGEQILRKIRQSEETLTSVDISNFDIAVVNAMSQTVSELNNLKRDYKNIRENKITPIESSIEEIKNSSSGFSQELSTLRSTIGSNLDEAKRYADKVKTDLLDSAGADFDTFKEIEDFIKQNQKDIRDLGKVAKKYVQNIQFSNGTHTINHNLGTKDVVVSVRDAVTNEFIMVTVNSRDLNNVTLTISGADSSINQIVVTVVG